MKSVKVAISLLALVAFAAPAAAQVKIKVQPIQIGGLFRGSGDLNLLKNKDVQKDLELSMAQIKTVKDLVTNQKKALENLKGKDRFQKIRELNQSNQKAVADLLNPKQTKRLGQLKVQQMGPRALIVPKYNKDLNITADQKKKLQQVFRSSFAKRRQIIQQTQGNTKERRKKIAQLNKEVTEEMVKGLTPKQQKKWQKIVGEPFKGVLPGRTGGFAVIRPAPAPGQVQPLPIQPKKIKIKIKNFKKIEPKNK